MRKCHWNIPDIASSVVKSLARSRRLINCDPSGTCDKEIPFVAVWVPVQFAHSTGSDRDEGSGNIGGGGKVGRVDNFKATGVGDYERLLLREVIGVFGIRLIDRSGGASNVLCRDVDRGWSARKDVAR